MTQITVRIPAPLRAYTGGADMLSVPADTVRQALAALAERHELMVQRVLTRDGQIRPYVNLFVGERNVRALDAPLKNGDVLSIVPSVAGG